MQFSYRKYGILHMKMAYLDSLSMPFAFDYCVFENYNRFSLMMP